MEDARMGQRMSKWLITEGILSIVFGFLVLVWPRATIAVFIYVLALYLLAAGVVGAIRGIENIGRVGWLAGFGQIILSIFAFIIGLVIFRHPTASFVAYVLWIGIWLMVRGLIYLFTQSATMSKAWSMFIGILSIIAGILLVIHPIAAGVAFYWVLGLYAIIVGPMLIFAGSSIRRGT